MRFSVRHETLYTYSAPVRLGEHTLRLSPREQDLSVHSAEILVEPRPDSRQDLVDADGNRLVKVSFGGVTSKLRIVSTFEGETQAMPVSVGAVPPLPWDTSAEARYMGDGEEATVRRFAENLLSEAGGNVEVFLEQLVQMLFRQTSHRMRPTGRAQAPEETLRTMSGACRDVAVLFMSAARAIGIPARFVSGYQAFADTSDGKRYLHAWPEVWLAGSGWRGYDPTHGTVNAGDHVGLAAAPEQRATMPVAGSYSSDGATSKLDFNLRIDAG